MFRLAYVLLVLLLIYQLVAQAKVAAGVITREEDPSSSRRTLFTIVWGCISTTIVCAWAAIHPNIPPREGSFKGALRRLELMLWTIVAPEILPCWALNQLFGAITVRDVYNDEKGYKKKGCGIRETVKGLFSLYEIKEAASPVWTVAHGHFLIMGGFRIVELESTEANTGNAQNRPPPDETILTLGMLRKLVKDPEFKIQITEDEIMHRAKGDGFSKLIIILQSTWFVLQCIGRRVQGLDLTQLELTTLALASLNGITFVLWWDKPLGAQALVRVYLKRRLTDSPQQYDIYNEWNPKFRSSRSAVINGCLTAVRGRFLWQSKGNIFISWLLRLLFAIILLPFLPIIAVVCISSVSLDDLLEGSPSFFPDSNDTHVPTFYAPKHRYSEWYHILLLITLAAIFGGIHCAGWNFSHSYQRLWRVASLSVTLIPIAIYPFAIILNSIIACRSPIIEPRPEGNPGALFLLLCVIAYLVARIALLVLAILQLKDLPPTAFIAIDWTKFYPHFL